MHARSIILPASAIDHLHVTKRVSGYDIYAGDYPEDKLRHELPGGWVTLVEVGEPAVAVKPLEWEKIYPDQTMFPHTYVGSGILGVMYHIERHYPYGEFYGFGQSQSYRSLNAAKAAAQADYERRILSALSTSPSPEVERLREEIRTLRAALERISSPTQTTDLLWWQIEARAALTGMED